MNILRRSGYFSSVSMCEYIGQENQNSKYIYILRSESTKAELSIYILIVGRLNKRAIKVRYCDLGAGYWQT